MHKTPFAHIGFATALSVLITLAQAQPTSTAPTVDAGGSAASSSQNAGAAKKSKKAPKTKAAASNPGTHGGAGNKSGSSRRDGADFDAPRPGAATSSPTGTGWDGYDAR